MFSVCICAGRSTPWISSEWLSRIYAKPGADLQTSATERHEHQSTEYIDQAR